MIPLAALLLLAQVPEPQKQTVVVTGQYEALPLEESERPVKALPVRGQPALLANSVVDFLQLDPSVFLQQRGAHNVQTDVSIRGGTFGQTLVLLNGLRVNDAQSGHHHMNLPVPVDSLEQVEVLKGSGSTLYGADALGGVVHFLSRTPEVTEFRARAAAGNFGTNQWRAAGTWVADRFSQQLAISRDFSTGFIPNRDYRVLSLSSTTHLRSRLGENTILLAHADRPFGAEQFYGNYPSWERTKAWFASVRQPLGDRTETAFAFRRHTDLFTLWRYEPQRYTNRHATESYQIAARRREPLRAGQTLFWGGEWLRDAIDSNNLGVHQRSRGAFYAAWDARSLRRFSLNLGARGEFFSGNGAQFLPSAALGYWLSSNWKLRASASRAFRLPTYTDLYYRDPATRGNPLLRPESATSYDGGLDFQPSNRFRASVTLFHRRETDGIDYIRRSPADPWQAANYQRLRFTGIETSATARLLNQQWEFAYTGLSGNQDALQDFQSRYVFNYARHSGYAGWLGSYRQFAARLRLGAIERPQRDPYAVLDLYFARNRGRVRPFCQLTNLTDTFYQEIAGVPMPGRGILAGLEVVLAR